MTDRAMGEVIAFRANARLIAEAEALAASEGISRSDVARRALLRDLDRARHLWRAGKWAFWKNEGWGF
jgi:hypothetical protein